MGANFGTTVKQHCRRPEHLHHQPASTQSPGKLGKVGSACRLVGDRRKRLLILLPKSWQHPRKGQLCSELTVVVDAVDQANPNLRMVVGHEDNVEELLAVGVELTQLRVHRFQCLQRPRVVVGCQ